MQKLYSIARVTIIFVLLFAQNALQAQKCCVECQADVKVVSDKQVLLEKIDIKKGTSLTNVNSNVYVSYRSGNAQKFWANLAIATAGVVVSTQLNNNTNVAEGKTVGGISPIVPLGISVATLPGIWKNRPRGVPQAGLYIQHRDLRGKLLDTWEQPISSEAKNSAELLTMAIDKPISEGTLEVYLQNGSKNGVFYWSSNTVKNMIIEEQLAKLSLPPKTPVFPNSVCLSCETPIYFQNDRGEIVFLGCAYQKDMEGCSGVELPEVIVHPEPEPTPPRGGEHPNNPNPNPPDGGGGGGGGGSGNNDRPETIERPYQTPLHPNSGKPELQNIPANFTWHMLGKGSRPNSRCNFMFTDLDFVELSVSQGQGGVFDGLYDWSATRSNHATNYSSDRQSAFVDIAYNVKRTPTFTVIFYSPAPISDDFTDYAVYTLN